jgi:hypothetical protein
MLARVLLLFSLAAAQESPVVSVVLKDGTTLVGRVAEEDATHLTVQTLEGLSVRVPRASIVSLREKPAARAGSFERPDPNYSRLMFAPTARPLRKGEGYFSDHYVLFPGVAYGVTDQLSLSGGVSVAPGIGLSEQVFYISPKLGFEVSQKLSLALGAAYAGQAEGEGAAVAFGLATFGQPQKSLTAGLGFAGHRDEEYDRRGDSIGRVWRWRDKPILMLAGSVQLSNSIALVSENWLLLGEKLSDQPFGLALRFFGERLSADVGVILVGAVIEEGFPVPWLSVSYHFGRAKDRASSGASRAPLPKFVQTKVRRPTLVP